MSAATPIVGGYSGFFPILADDESHAHRDALRAALMALPSGEGSLFSRTRLVHGARMFVLADAVYNGRPSREEHFAHAYLAVSITFDGPLATMCAAVAANGAAEFLALFSHCHGCPATADAATVLGYFEACRIDPSFLYVDTDASLEDVLAAIRRHALIADLVLQGQGKPAAERKALVRNLAAEIAALPKTEPGGFTAWGATP